MGKHDKKWVTNMKARVFMMKDQLRLSSSTLTEETWKPLDMGRSIKLKGHCFFLCIAALIKEFKPDPEEYPTKAQRDEGRQNMLV